MNIELQRLQKTMTAQSYKTDVVANNLSNINTSGFKRDILFYDVLSSVEKAKVEVQVHTDFSQGTLKETGNPLDLALSGKGFFSIDKGGETHFTRDGHFSVNKEGFMVTSAGDYVLGEGGRIQLTADGQKVGKISLSNVGEVFVDDELMDSLKIVDFNEYTGLKKAGHNLFKNQNSASALEVEGTTVLQGNLEGSNVSPVNEMIELMNIQRSYESTQRAIRTMDETANKATSEVAQYR